MAKRFTDTDIWDQDWFVALPSKYKLFWQYIKDKCDDSGVWRPNKELFQRIISEPINLNEFLVFINTEEKQRISVLNNGRWFLKEYFIFQYGTKFNPQSPVHRGFLKRLILNNIHINEIPNIECYNLKDADYEILRQIAYQYPTDTLLIAYGYPTDRVKDKDKDNYLGKYENPFSKKTGGKNKNKFGIKFDDSFEVVYFSDGSSQRLGKQQKELAQSGDLTPRGVFLGSEY